LKLGFKSFGVVKL